MGHKWGASLEEPNQRNRAAGRSFGSNTNRPQFIAGLIPESFRGPKAFR
jgi:hypothetical protein